MTASGRSGKPRTMAAHRSSPAAAPKGRPYSLGESKSRQSPSAKPTSAAALTLAACALALEDAGVRPGDVRPERVGLVLGTAYGPLDTMWAHTQRVQTGGIRRASSVLFLHSFVNTPISLASIEFDIQGPVACFCQGLASAGAALQFGRDLVADGHADLVLAGGVDAL